MLKDRDFPPLPSQAPRKKTKPLAKRPCRREATGLNDLPVELVLEIISYLPGIDVQHFQLLTLTSLSLTNRRLHTIVGDRLYTSYDSLFCAPYPFLRTVMSNARLASHVKSMFIRYGPNSHADRLAYAPSIADKQLIKDGLKKLAMSDWKVWASSCNETNSGAELLYATMLMCTPNVASLEIGDGALQPKSLPKWLWIIRQIVNGHFFGKVHRFEHLHSIRVDVQYLKLGHLAPVFKLRSMRKVTLIGLVEWAHLEDDRPDSLRRVLPAGISLVEEVHISKSFVHGDILDVLFSSFRKLKMFRYWSTDERFVNGHAGVDYWRSPHAARVQAYNDDSAGNNYYSIVESLVRHQTWLETLSLSDDRSIHRAAPFTARFRNFTVLADLTVYYSMLIKDPVDGASIAENIPRSIQSLTIQFGDSVARHYKQVFRYLALNCQQYAPSLQKLRLVEDSVTIKWDRGWVEVEKLFADRGIAFELGSVYSQDYDYANWSSTARSETDEDSDLTSDEESLYSN
ncbi:hypothetical protein BU23DRAFT_549596 [Bimuria novae-zelandiae CBS 107.79]|uniref:F-box domain-containing protein n=1 Tax=Bimuria novae-zelandiae CBS 107.79 TaxID=1447943 RepID=A0A6A5VT47_9PLEO|nr:hypothetical protein BU23DRAFT_549596 [Bimuria novae-zelandiae CBS 107.79]